MSRDISKATPFMQWFWNELQTTVLHELGLHNFSFSPLSIYISGINRQTDIAYDNWKTRMKMHHPSKAEHPILYKEDIFTNRRKYG